MLRSSHDGRGKYPKTIRRETIRKRILAHQSWVHDVAISGKGCVAAVDRAGILSLHKIVPPTKVAHLRTINESVELKQLTCVCWSSTDEIVYGSDRLRIQNVYRSDIYATSAPVKKSRFLSITKVGARGHLIASGAHDGTIQIFDARVPSFQCVATVGVSYFPIRSIAATKESSGALLITAESSAVKLYDVRAPSFKDDKFGRWRANTHSPHGNSVASLMGHRGLVRSVALSDDGKIGFSGGEDKTMRIWKVLAARSNYLQDNDFLSMHSHSQQISSEISHSGKSMNDVCSSEQGECRLILPGSVLSVACNASGSVAMATSDDGGVYCSAETISSLPSHSMWGECREGDQAADACLEKGDISADQNTIFEELSSTYEESVDISSTQSDSHDSSFYKPRNTVKSFPSVSYSIAGGRRAYRLGSLVGRPLCCSVSSNGLWGVTGSDEDDNNALRIWDLRLLFNAYELRYGPAKCTAVELKDAGFRVRTLTVTAGFSGQELLAAGFSASDLVRGNVGFTGRDLVRLGCSVTELRKAGFDDAKSLRRLGCSAIELKEKGFTPKELWSGGYCLRELVAAGVTGEALRALGCSIDDLLGNVWETQGPQAYLDQLCQVALEWSYTTEHGVKEIKKNIEVAMEAKKRHAEKVQEFRKVREGRGLSAENIPVAKVDAEAMKFDLLHYTQMWEDRLEVTHRRAHLLVNDIDARNAMEAKELAAEKRHANAIAKLHGETSKSIAEHSKGIVLEGAEEDVDLVFAREEQKRLLHAEMRRTRDAPLSVRQTAVVAVFEDEKENDHLHAGSAEERIVAGNRFVAAENTADGLSHFISHNNSS